MLMYDEPRLTRDMDITFGAPVDVLPRVLEMVPAWASGACRKALRTF